MRIILLLPLVARYQETIDVCIWRMCYVSCSYCVGMFVDYRPLLKIVGLWATYPSSPQSTYNTTTDCNKTDEHLLTTRKPTGHILRKTSIIHQRIRLIATACSYPTT